VNCVL